MNKKQNINSKPFTHQNTTKPSLKFHTERMQTESLIYTFYVCLSLTFFCAISFFFRTTFTAKMLDAKEACVGFCKHALTSHT